jgi:hypothetical protein
VLSLLGVFTCILEVHSFSLNALAGDDSGAQTQALLERFASSLETLYDKLETLYDKLETLYDKLETLYSANINLLEPLPPDFYTNAKQCVEELDAWEWTLRDYFEPPQDYLNRDETSSAPWPMKGDAAETRSRREIQRPHFPKIKLRGNDLRYFLASLEKCSASLDPHLPRLL